MDNSIIVTKNNDYQLISIGIDLVNRILVLNDNSPCLSSNPKIKKLAELARQWNEVFITNYISKEGVK
jgi:hypothetical protein